MRNRRARLFPISAFSFLRRKPARRRSRYFERSHFRPETLEVRQLLSATPVQPQPLPLEQSDEGVAPIESFPPAERPYVEFVRSLDVPQFRQVRGWQARYLTPGQLQSIPNNRTFRTLPGAVRRNLTTDQLQSLNVRRSGLLGMTRGQINQLTTEQIHSLRLRDFKRLSPDQIPELTVAQIRRIPSMRWFHRFKMPQREAFTTNQVRALDVRKTGLAGLSPDQVAVLTGRQIESLWEKDIAFLNADQLTMLAPQQLEWLDPAWATDQINGGAEGAPRLLIRPDRAGGGMQGGDLTVGPIRAPESPGLPTPAGPGSLGGGGAGSGVGGARRNDPPPADPRCAALWLHQRPLQPAARPARGRPGPVGDHPGGDGDRRHHHADGRGAGHRADPAAAPDAHRRRRHRGQPGRASRGPGRRPAVGDPDRPARRDPAAHAPG